MDPVAAPIHGDSIILDQKMVEVSPHLGVRVGVFRFAPSSDESTRATSERNRVHGIERMVINVYRYIRDHFDPEDRVQVDIESSDLNLENVTSTLVNVRHADPFVLLDRMESDRVIKL